MLGQTLEWVELPNDLVARLEGKSSLGRLGLLIHSTAGYVDPGWKGNLTLELSNVANLPIALYFGMRIGQISFFRMSSPVERPYGSPELGSKYQGQSRADRVRLPPRFRQPDGSAEETSRVLMGLNDAVDWSARAGRRDAASRSSRPAPSDPTRGPLFGPVPRLLWERHVSAELTDDHRLLQALNCLLVETPAGRVLVETGIGERVDEQDPRDAPIPGPADRPGAAPGRLRSGDRGRRGDEPPPLRPRRRASSTADGRGRSRGPGSSPSARSGRSRSATTRGSSRSYDQPELRLVRDWGAEGWADGERELLPGVTRRADGGPLGGPPGDRRPWRGSRRADAGLLRGPRACGRGARTRRWVTAFDDFPLDSVLVKGELFGRASEEDWIVVLSHEPLRPVGRLVRDRDRYRFEPA